MKAIVCHEYGPISGLDYTEIDSPKPGPKEVVIRAEAIGVNFPDGLLVQGLYQAKPPTPFTPGMEVVGEVAAVGDEVKRFKVGDRVGSVATLGAYAEEVKAHQNGVMPVPPGVDAGEVTALMCGYGTAHHALKQRAQLQPGETLAVTGAAGLTGLAAVEIGKAMGATVIASASSAEKLHVALEHGADFVINYAEEDIRQRVLDLTGGADVVYDPVGGDAFTASLRCINPGGRILIIGFASGTIPQIPANHLLVKDAAALGFSVNQLRRNNPEAVQAAMRELLAWVADGRLKPLVSSVVPFEEFQDAMRLLRDRRSTGKVAIRVR